MALQRWNPADKNANITLSDNDHRAYSGYGGFVGVRSTVSFDAATANVYIEFDVEIADYVGVGICKSTDALTDLYTRANSRLYYSHTPVFSGGVNIATGPAFVDRDRISLVVKNGKVYWARNGVYLNSGNPVAETGWLVSGLTGTYFIAADIRGGAAILRVTADELDYPVPAGTGLFLNPGTVTATLKDLGGTPVASESVKWAFFDAVSPDLIATVHAKGTATTSGAGVLTLAIPHTELANGATGSLLVSNTDGSASNQCDAHYAPVAITVP